MKRVLKRIMALFKEHPGGFSTDEDIKKIHNHIRNGDEKLDKAIATVDGDLNWFLCLTNDRNLSCGKPGRSEGKNDV